MIDALVNRVPVPRRTEILGVPLVVLAFIAGGVAVDKGVKTHYVTYRSVKHVPISYGQPSQVIEGAKVNPQLAGWTCSVYAAKHTIVCK